MLAPYGVTNERLDAASDYYRYNQSAGELWRHRAARATATIRNGNVVSVTLVDAGAGYSATPHLTVARHPRGKLRAELGDHRWIRASSSTTRAERNATSPIPGA